MPRFINNKGESVMPSLLILAMVNDGLTEADIERIPPGLKPRVLSTRSLLGYLFPRSPNRNPVYLEKDLTGTLRLEPTISLNGTSQADDEYVECVLPLAISYEHASRADVENWPRVSNKIRSRVRDIEVCFFRSGGACGEFLALSSVRTRPHAQDSKPLALEVTSIFLHWLVEDGVDMFHIRRVVIVEPVHRRLHFVWLDAMPRLKHLDMDYCVNDLSPLLSLKHSLEVLRIQSFAESTIARTFESVLSEMSSLKLLITSFLPIPYAIRWRELKLSASLRSLILIGVDPGTTADVVTFLTSEVDVGGEVIARQHLLDDFTIIGGGPNGANEAMDGVYRSEALSQRMKDRIFSNTNIGHVTSALQLAIRRINYGHNAVLLDVIRMARMVIHETCYHQPQPILLSVLLDLTRHSVCLKPDVLDAFALMQELLRTKDLVNMYDPRNVLCFEETANRIGPDVGDRSRFGPILRAHNRVADECDVIPRDSYTVLIAAAGLMKISPAFLESVCLKHIKKVEPSHLPKVFKEIENPLCIMIAKLIATWPGNTGGVVLSAVRDQNVTNDMVEFLTFIKEKATDEVADLLVAANAVLRRSAIEPLSNDQLNGDDGRKELVVLRRVFPYATLQLQND